MYDITWKEQLAEAIHLMKIKAPMIAHTRKAGQFIVLRIDEQAERVPLTIADSDPAEGTITIIFQAVGEMTKKLASLKAGDAIQDVVGPLGQPTHIEKFGHAACLGGGLGIALLYPIVKALHAAGNRVTTIMSARNKCLLILRDWLKDVSDEIKIATDDGSEGHHGFPTDILKQMLDAGGVDIVFAVGPVPMMAAVANLTRPYKVKTIASLNPIMVDGTGMCGGCRVTVGGETKFACVDGPEFDAHLVDFKELARRNKMYDGYKKPVVHADFPAVSSARDPHQLHTTLPEAEQSAGKARLKRVEMPQQPVAQRIRNFDEVPLGYTPEMAVAEAKRCLQCKKPMCMSGCPVGIDIPGFIKLIAEGEFIAAARKLKEQNSLPAVCGRVCPQEEQCEKLCVLGKKGDPVAIGNLERFAADYEREHNAVVIPPLPPKNGKRVAIVGSGPAGLTAAGELVKMGYDVTVFEALHKAGGVLVYGIPEFRLPKAIVQAEVDYLKALGVEIRLNCVVGKSVTVDELLNDGYHAAFIGSGAGLPIFAGVPGENLNRVFSANEYLTRVNLMKAYRRDYATPVYVGKRVAVLGGGNVAMDSARTCLRLGFEKVMIIYRRSQTESPARREELHRAIEEGVEFHWLTNVVEVLGDGQGWVRGMRCIRMELGEPGPDGRRSPVPIKGSEFDMEVDCVIVAYGNNPHPLVARTTPGMETDRRGRIKVVDNSGQTTKKGVYAGGDIVTGAATVILAMGAGKSAAAAIHKYLQSGDAARQG